MSEVRFLGVNGNAYTIIAPKPIVNHGTSDTGTSSAPFALTPDAKHVWGEVASLYLSFGAGITNYMAEYYFQFDSGSTPTTLVLPSSVKWAGNVQPTIAANMRYQIDIEGGIANVSFASL